MFTNKNQFTATESQQHKHNKSFPHANQLTQTHQQYLSGLCSRNWIGCITPVTVKAVFYHRGFSNVNVVDESLCLNVKCECTLWLYLSKLLVEIYFLLERVKRCWKKIDRIFKPRCLSISSKFIYCYAINFYLS